MLETVSARHLASCAVGKQVSSLLRIPSVEYLEACLVNKITEPSPENLEPSKLSEPLFDPRKPEILLPEFAFRPSFSFRVISLMFELEIWELRREKEVNETDKVKIDEGCDMDE